MCITRLNKGKILFVYSGGLHHIHTPGDKFPRFFKKIRVNLELLNIQQYKQNLSSPSSNFKIQVMNDLNKRLKYLTPE